MKPPRRTKPKAMSRGTTRRRVSPCDETQGVASNFEADKAIVLALVGWFRNNARPLPWRTTPRRPWPSLVSELMAQQTQISRVIEKYAGFLDRFPTPHALAVASESEVLAAWAGLGYYRRAKLLQRAAAAIVEVHGGRVPSTLDELKGLPGVGEYTAGAIAPIVFDVPAPIVDGNVARVLLRLSATRSTAAASASWCWDAAGQLARAAGPRVAAFNEGLMELGALICTPRNPNCGECPLAASCRAKALGLQEQIPLPKSPPNRAVLRADVIVVTDATGRFLVEQRPGRGLWASMWQVPTREVLDPSPLVGPLFEGEPLDELRRHLGLPTLRAATGPREFTHQTSHRRVEFRVWKAVVAGKPAKPAKAESPPRRWLTREELQQLPLANPQRLMLLGDATRPPSTRPTRSRTLFP